MYRDVDVAVEGGGLVFGGLDVGRVEGDVAVDGSPGFNAGAGGSNVSLVFVVFNDDENDQVDDGLVEASLDIVVGNSHAA